MIVRRGALAHWSRAGYAYIWIMLTQRPNYSYRDAPDVPTFDDSGPVAVMDATCGLCAKGARWIAHNDRAQAFRIIPVQSALGGALARHYGQDPDDPVTWIVIEQGRAYGSLDAMIQVGRRFGGRWRILQGLRLIPRFLRDRAYLLVARNRYRIMGRADLCNLPDPEIQKRLITEGPAGSEKRG